MKKLHRNQVRIIGGGLRGRKIHFTEVEGLRPTADSVRERLFNWLGQNLTGKTVLDLFAGSGALGMEAASRQAQHVVMVEHNRQVITQLKNNVSSLKLNKVDVICAEAINYLSQIKHRFDVVFLDPPYAWQQWTLLLRLLPALLTTDAMVYIEAGHLPEWDQAWVVCKQGKSGISRFVLLQYQRESG